MRDTFYIWLGEHSPLDGYYSTERAAREEAAKRILAGAVRVLVLKCVAVATVEQKVMFDDPQAKKERAK